VMAIAAVPSQLAPIAGPLLGGLVVDAAGWRWIFWLNVPIGLLALLLSARGLPAGERGAARRLDLLGLALLSPALALLVLGLSRTELLPLVAGAALLAAFVTHALRTAEAPLIDVRLFRHRALAAASALNFLSRLSIFGASLLIPLYYQQIRGYAALAAGLLMAPQSLGTMLALPLVGKLTDRLGARPVVLTGIGVSALAALCYTRVGATTPFPVLAGSLLVWGIGVAAVAVPVSAAAYHGLPPAEIPNATSAITMIQTVGASAGAAVLSAILLSRGGGAAAYAYTFRWVLIFGVLALGPALVLPAAPARQAERV
jgi:EmrB/QacA subfamily drug resistance transporter